MSQRLNRIYIAENAYFFRVGLPLHHRIQWNNSFRILLSIVWNNVNSYELMRMRMENEKKTTLWFCFRTGFTMCVTWQWCDHNRIKIWNHKLFLWLTDGLIIIIIIKFILLHLCHIGVSVWYLVLQRKSQSFVQFINYSL